MAEWQSARLFSTDGIESKADARRRATEALMATMAAAPTAGRSLLGALGVRVDARTSIESYVGVSLGRVRTDGVVVARKGRSEVAVAFVVRVAGERLTPAVVKKVRDAAAHNGVAAVVTITGESTGPDLGRGRSSIPVAHWPWGNVLTALVDQKVRDPEQTRILGDLVAFLQHADIGVGAGSSDMGAEWAAVLKTARTSRLSVRNAGVADVARRWDQVARTVGTGLGAAIDRDVQLSIPAREARDVDVRLDAVVRQLADTGRLEAVWTISDAAGDLAVVADLAARRLVTVVAVQPPDGLGERATVGWLLDGLEGASPDTVIEAWGSRGAEPVAAARLDDLNQDMSLLSSTRKISSYRVLLADEMGTARSSKGRSVGFADSVAAIVERTWTEILGPLSGAGRRTTGRSTSGRTARQRTTSKTTARKSTSSRKSTTSRKTTTRKSTTQRKTTTRSTTPKRTSSRKSSSSRKAPTRRTTSTRSSGNRKSPSELARELRSER